MPDGRHGKRLRATFAHWLGAHYRTLRNGSQDLPGPLRTQDSWDGRSRIHAGDWSITNFIASWPFQRASVPFELRRSSAPSVWRTKAYRVAALLNLSGYRGPDTSFGWELATGIVAFANLASPPRVPELPHPSMPVAHAKVVMGQDCGLIATRFGTERHRLLSRRDADPISTPNSGDVGCVFCELALSQAILAESGRGSISCLVCKMGPKQTSHSSIVCGNRPPSLNFPARCSRCFPLPALFLVPSFPRICAAANTSPLVR